MKPIHLLFLLLLAVPRLDAQEASCCGPITPAGDALLQFLDDLHVEDHWKAHEHIDWKTGDPIPSLRHEPPTHCSTFAAAAAMRLHIYLLRPPEHSQVMLSLGQEQWLGSDKGRNAGWRAVDSVQQAQTLANQGEFVVLVFGREHGAGHVAIVRPAIKSQRQLDREGPETTQAGGHNFTDGTAKRSFVNHPGAWPDQVKIFAHPTDFEHAN